MAVSTLMIVLHACIPAVFLIIGGMIGSVYSLNAKAKSIKQHLVSGAVFAAVAVDLLPNILASGSPITVGGGFLVGVIVMLSLMELAHRLEHRDETLKSLLPIGLLFAVLIDMFVDGILIGISFLAGTESGGLITFALTTCVFFLGIATFTVLKERLVALPQQIIWMILLAVSMPVGALIGSTVIKSLPEAWLIETLAFGVAALLYLGAEELLVEAHKEEDSPWITSAFFIGFLAILLLKL